MTIYLGNIGDGERWEASAPNRKSYTIAVGRAGWNSNIDLFNPNKQIVFGHKAGNGDARYVGRYTAVSDDQYIEQYYEILNNHREAIAVWIGKQWHDVALTCFCPWNAALCHTHVLKKWLVQQRAVERMKQVREDRNAAKEERQARRLKLYFQIEVAMLPHE